jgi:hypothetical protein
MKWHVQQAEARTPYLKVRGGRPFSAAQRRRIAFLTLCGTTWRACGGTLTMPSLSFGCILTLSLRSNVFSPVVVLPGTILADIYEAGGRRRNA